MIQQLQRNLAHVLMCEAVITGLRSQDDLAPEARKEIIALYKERKKRYRKNLKMARGRFPDFHRRYLELLARRSTIYSGWNHVKEKYDHGDLSAKGYVSTQYKVQKQLERISEIMPTISSNHRNVSEMLAGSEFFDELSEEDMESLEKNSTCINFLAGDTIMSAYETGDSFYILIAGKATVWRTDALSYKHHVADLRDGDIMGESSLLAEYKSGKHIRSATIMAKTPCTVVRVSKRTMLKILYKYPEIKDIIQEIHDERGADHAPQINSD